jgi:arsenate reductase
MKIFHNPSCSKSRASLERIQSHAADETIEIIEYLKATPTFAELQDLLKKLGLPAQAIVRQNESLFLEKHSKLDLNDDAAVLRALIADPILIERPIIVRGERAVIGRPPENVDLLWK